MLLGDSRSVIRDSLADVWHCLRVSVLIVLSKLQCKYVFENGVSSLDAFCQLWIEEVHIQLLEKGTLLIKDTKLLNYATYSDFIAVLVALRKSM